MEAIPERAELAGFLLVDQELANALDLGFGHVRRVFNVLLARLLEIDRRVGQRGTKIVLKRRSALELLIKQHFP